MKKKKYFEVYDPEDIESKFLELPSMAFKFGDYTFGERDKYLFEIKCPIRGWQGIIPEDGVLYISGKEKSRKSTLAGMFTSSYISNTFCSTEPYKYIGHGTECEKYDRVMWPIKTNGFKKVALYFDTEQPRSDFNRSQATIITNAGLSEKPVNYHAFPLARYGDSVTKLQMMMKVIDFYNIHLGLVVADVITDLVDSENDNEQAKDLWGLINAKKAEYGFAFINTIHQNRNNENTTGGIGLMGNKKANFGIKIIKDDIDDENAPSLAKVEFKRHSEYFKPFFFGFDDDTKLPKVFGLADTKPIVSNNYPAFLS